MEVDKKYFVAVITSSDIFLLLLTLIAQLVFTSVESMIFTFEYVLRV